MGISFPGTKPVNPLEGMVVYDPVTTRLEVFNGVTWHELTHKLCMVCKYAEVDHGHYSQKYSDGHKFVGDNLEFLEYKYEQSIR